MVSEHPPFDAGMVAAMQACLEHSRDLLASARAVQVSGHAHIAYHLAALALEEVGRRELIGVQSIAASQPVSPAWPSKHMQDHVQKLFWAFFGGSSFYAEKLTGKRLDEMVGTARYIHVTRLAGLYVDHGQDGLSIPRDAISPEECNALIEFVDARLQAALSETLRDAISDEEVERQTWFLRASEDPERMRMIMSGASMEKLAELKDVRAWVSWLKEIFDNAEAEAREAAEIEIKRVPGTARKDAKDKWRFRIRILSGSHVIRPKTLTAWNKDVGWIKLVAVSGKKSQLLVEFTLKDYVTADRLWWFGWGVARQFVVALNIATMGFWWWRLPEHISKFYEALDDLESKRSFVVERSPSLKIDWGENKVLSEEDLSRLKTCFAALPRPDEQQRLAALNYYTGGITFLSLNDIHWQCEIQAFGNFFESLKAMMMERGEVGTEQVFETAFARFLDDMFPKMDERDRLIGLCKAFESGKLEGIVVTLKEVSFIKLFCDAYFLRTVQPAWLKERFSGSTSA